MGKLLPPHVNVFLRTCIAGILHQKVVRGTGLMEHGQTATPERMVCAQQKGQLALSCVVQ